MFRLHERLQQDTFEVCRLELCRVLLMNDARFPWLILVPAREGITEIHRMWEEDKKLFWQEVDQCAQAMESCFNPHKLNLGALGNMVPQLHFHIIARWREDTAWPGPVWGFGTAEAYLAEEADNRMEKIRSALEAGLKG